MPIFHAPVTVRRIDGQWQTMERLSEVSIQYLADADPSPTGEVPQTTVIVNDRPEGRVVFLRGRVYKISEETAAELAEVEGCTDLPGKVDVRVILGDWIRPDPPPPADARRELLKAQTWPTTGQQAAIDAITDGLAAINARLDTIEARQSAVS